MSAEPSHSLFAGIELGGTKCIGILGTGPQDIRAQVELPTQEPEETLSAIEGVLDDWRAAGEVFLALGIAAFGPLDLRRDSSRYGWVSRTVKPGWTDTELLGRFARRYPIPIGIDTDVNAAARAEGQWGGARGMTDFAYVTVGTGIGVGLVVNGLPVSGAHHTELGHIRVVRSPGDDFAGVCPFHGDCLEGLAAGPAIAARCGGDVGRLSAGDPLWRPIAHALAQLCQTLVLSTGPRRIFFGGGVMLRQPHLLAMIRKRLQESLNNYVDSEEVGIGIDQFIVPSALAARVGPLGSLAIAAESLAKNGKRPL